VENPGEWTRRFEPKLSHYPQNCPLFGFLPAYAKKRGWRKAGLGWAGAEVGCLALDTSALSCFYEKAKMNF
jgi:hypothetical protein